MIIFLRGPDDWRREARKRFYVEGFKKKYSGLNVGVFDLLEDDGLENLRVFLRSQSIFQSKKLAVVEGGFDESVRETLSKILSALVKEKNITVILSEKKEPVRALSFLSEKPVIGEQFDFLSGSEWTSFIKQEAKKSGFSLDSRATQFLAEVYKENTWALVTELEKLANLSKKIVTRADLESLGLETLPNYWAVVNSLRGSRFESRLWALEKLFAQKEPAAKVFNILSSLWREKIPQMAEYDFKVKSGKLEYEEALVDLML